MQLPDRFELRFDDPHFSLFDRDAFGMGGGWRSRCAPRGTPSSPSGRSPRCRVEPGVSGRHELVVTGFDLTHRLHRGPRTRTFQRTSDADAAARIAQEHGFDVDVDRGGKVHDYLVQASETDYAFLRRRAAHVGFDFWIADRTSTSSGARPGRPPHQPALGRTCQRFTVRFSSAERCDEVRVRGWDPLGKRAVEGRSSQADPDGRARGARSWRVRHGAASSGSRFAAQLPVADDTEAAALAERSSPRASGARWCCGAKRPVTRRWAPARWCDWNASGNGWRARTGSPASSTCSPPAGRT